MIDLISLDEVLNTLLQAIEEEPLKEVALHIREEYLIDTKYLPDSHSSWPRLEIKIRNDEIRVWNNRHGISVRLNSELSGKPTNIEKLKKNYPEVFNGKFYWRQNPTRVYDINFR